jgi:hypothetical protein
MNLARFKGVDLRGLDVRQPPHCYIAKLLGGAVAGSGRVAFWLLFFGSRSV